MKAYAKTFLLILLSIFPMPFGAGAVEGITESERDKPLRVSPGNGLVRLAQLQDQEKTGFLAKASGQIGVPIRLPIRFRPDAPVRWRTLLFKDVPRGCAVSPGIRIDDTHYVSIEDIDNIALTISKNAPADMRLTVVLSDNGQGRSREVHDLRITVSGTAVSIFEADAMETAPSASMSVTVPSAAPTAAPPSVKPTAIAPSAVESLPRLDSGIEESYLQRAGSLLKLGQIASARQLLEHLANKGSARGALLLGQTYDEAYLKSLNVVGGVSGDAATALRWYKRAEELGSTDASGLIRRLKS